MKYCRMTIHFKTFKFIYLFTMILFYSNIQLQTILLPSISILIVLVLHVNSLCGSVAKLCLNAVVKAHNISLRALYTRYKLQLCSVSTNLIYSICCCLLYMYSLSIVCYHCSAIKIFLKC